MASYMVTSLLSNPDQGRRTETGARPMERPSARARTFGRWAGARGDQCFALGHAEQSAYHGPTHMYIVSVLAEPEIVVEPEGIRSVRHGTRISIARLVRTPVSWSFAVSRFTKRVALPAGPTEPTQGRGGPSGSIPVRSVGQVVHPIEP
jgi:hypothetical protein